jgi:hypothetical protein
LITFQQRQGLGGGAETSTDLPSQRNSRTEDAPATARTLPIGEPSPPHSAGKRRRKRKKRTRLESEQRITPQPLVATLP